MHNPVSGANARRSVVALDGRPAAGWSPAVLATTLGQATESPVQTTTSIERDARPLRVPVDVDPGRVAPYLLRGATLPDNRVLDVRIEDGRVAAVGRELPAAPGDVVEDLRGYVLLPGLVEPHAHLDKAYTVDRVDNATGDLPGAIEAWLAFRPATTVADIADRARRAALRYVAHGTTSIRTHVDTGDGVDLRAVEALVAVRRELEGLVDIQIVALCSVPVTGPEGAVNRGLLEGALLAGADLVGGAPNHDEDPEAALDILLEIADRHGRGVDFHVDETLSPEVLTLPSLVVRVRDRFRGPVTASHCVSLGVQPPDVQAAIARGLAETGIGIVTLPITNLFLQGRESSGPTPRGLTAIRALRAAGVRVAAGGDNLRDPFNPMGRADPLEAASLLVTAGHLDPAAALAAVSEVAADVIGRPVHALSPGSVADLVAVRASSLADAIGSADPSRVVIRHGRIVARSKLETEFWGADRRLERGGPTGPAGEAWR